ncbi:hypothetical protein [Actinomadura sp. WMMA1423]|uniref:hypothetical protein n=1 Tax=Actinomadura sp. WMMA1423 TaxID=2591108 RepID=UPI001146D3C0|nr:hypothetical protein [Actinomadura sp. WMMA1423]
MTLYALIDNEQQFHIRKGDYKPELGPEGTDLVTLHPGTRMAAFVNDCGFSLPDRCPRNTLGALVAIRLGAVFRPLAGPVVFTGWNSAGCGSEIRDLTPSDIQTLTGLHRDFTAALAGTYTGAAWWADTVRRDADALRAAAAPTLTVLGGI